MFALLPTQDTQQHEMQAVLEDDPCSISLNCDCPPVAPRSDGACGTAGGAYSTSASGLNGALDRMLLRGGATTQHELLAMRDTNTRLQRRVIKAVLLQPGADQVTLRLS